MSPVGVEERYEIMKRERTSFIGAGKVVRSAWLTLVCCGLAACATVSVAAAASFVLPVSSGAVTGGGLDTRYSADAVAADDELVDTRYWAEAWSAESVLDTKTPVGTFLMIR